jgi:RNA polymerase-binding transcription factor DksA
MGFFSSKKDVQPPVWAADLQETQQRLFTFLDNLEAKMQELCEAALPQLKELFCNDPDIYHREFYRVRSGVSGQLEQIQKKARDVREEKVEGLYQDLKDEGISVTDPHYNLLRDFRIACSERFEAFDRRCHDWRRQVAATDYEDLEQRYQQVLQEYESSKDKFQCKQCGAPISINELFFIDVLLPCSSCHTQNTFSPGTQAKNVLNFAQDLAEQRTAGLHQDFEAAQQRERELYMLAHENRERLSDDARQKKERAALRAAYEAEHRTVVANIPALYEKYIRAFYGEWIKITPFQKEHLLQRMENALADPRFSGG